MACRFTKVSEEEIVAINEAAFCYSSDLVKINTKTTIPLWVGEERWIHTVPFKSKSRIESRESESKDSPMTDFSILRDVVIKN